MSTGKPRTITITPLGHAYLAAMRARDGEADTGTVTVPGWVIMDALLARDALLAELAACGFDQSDRMAIWGIVSEWGEGVDKAGRDMVE